MTQEELDDFKFRMEQAKLAGNADVLSSVESEFEHRQIECQIHTGQRVTAICEKLDMLSEKLDKLSAYLDDLHSRNSKRIDELEDKVSGIEPRLGAVEAKLDTIVQDKRDTKKKLEGAYLLLQILKYVTVGAGGIVIGSGGLKPLATLLGLS